MEKVVYRSLDGDSGLILLVLAWLGLQEISLIGGLVASIVVAFAAIWRIVMDTKKYQRDSEKHQIVMMKLEEELKKLREDNQ